MKKTLFTGGWRFAAAGEPLRPVILPHDAMLHRPRDPAAPSGSAGAYFPGGRYVYEKSFTLDAEAVSRHTLFYFEGVYKNARVLINGAAAGQNAYGYLPFSVPADGLLREGENCIRVECDNVDQPDSRWYSGAGIYLPVWMLTGPSASLEPGSVRVTTTSVDPPAVRVETAVSEGEVSVEILDGEQVIAAAEGADVAIPLPGAGLWSEESPKLYSARVTRRMGEETDTETVSFGIRTIAYSPQGFFVNGRRTLLRGGCVHHDNGILGAATFDESVWRRVRMLKEAGFNAIRSAHNPCCRAMLEACDKLGMYIMDESWDMWFGCKSRYDYASQWPDHYKDDLAAMVRKDYNHPSVILYSIGNEVSEPAGDKGLQKEREMVDLLHALDPTRPVTGGFNLMIIANAAKGKSMYKEEGGLSQESGGGGGMNSTFFNLITNFVGTGMNKAANSKKADAATSPALDALDIAGYNYASGRYPLEGKAHPERVIFGSETFPQDIAKNWEMVERYPYLIGDFMWTAWDYLGEVGLGAWAYTPDGRGFNKPYPWLLADTGAIDILGNPTAELFLAQAAWGKLPAPAIAVQPVGYDRKPAKMVWRGSNGIPSWSWQGCGGQKAVVEVYAARPARWAALTLNGRSFGRRRLKGCKATFHIRYLPGTLEAAALDENGKELGRGKLISCAGKLSIALSPEKKAVRPGGVVYIPLAIRGENGEVESRADRTVGVTVEGGTLLGFGSANPRTEERFDTGRYTTYYGRALIAVQAGERGTVTVTATDGREGAKVKLPIIESD